MFLNSFKFKISILYSILLGAILVLYSYFLYWGLSVALYDELDKELKTKARATADVLNLYLRATGDSPKVVDYVFNRISFPEEVDARLEVVAKIDFYWAQRFEKLNMQDDLMHLVGPNGSGLGKSKRLSNELGQIFLSQLKGFDYTQNLTFADIHYKKRVLRLVSMPCFFNGKGPYVLQIAVSQKPVIQLLKNRLYATITSVPVLFLLMFFIGFFFVGQLMRPVVEVTRAADNISHRDLSLRVTTQYRDAEMRRLAAAFNDMIARLEKAFKHIEEFSSQVAHELRTPLAIMRGESELALRKDRDSEEYKRVIRVNLEEIGRMLKTVEDLLLLTKLDYRPEIFKMEDFDFVVFFREVFEQARVLAQDKGITIELDVPQKGIILNGDKHHLRRLFYNLIHNAVKFTLAEGKIRLGVSVSGERLLAKIQDTGVGIPSHDLPKIFDRFFHKDRGIVMEEAGSGLGLSIAMAIARSHGGDITVDSALGQGSTFMVSLPLSHEI
jgi:two-component system, OmpR family, heavy metal sensor histidine kinase CusS